MANLHTMGRVRWLWLWGLLLQAAAAQGQHTLAQLQQAWAALPAQPGQAQARLLLVQHYLQQHARLRSHRWVQATLWWPDTAQLALVPRSSDDFTDLPAQVLPFSPAKTIGTGPALALQPSQAIGSQHRAAVLCMAPGESLAPSQWATLVQQAQQHGVLALVLCATCQPDSLPLPSLPPGQQPVALLALQPQHMQQAQALLAQPLPLLAQVRAFSQQVPLRLQAPLLAAQGPARRQRGPATTTTVQLPLHRPQLPLAQVLLAQQAAQALRGRRARLLLLPEHLALH